MPGRPPGPAPPPRPPGISRGPPSASATTFQNGLLQFLTWYTPPLLLHFRPHPVHPASGLYHRRTAMATATMFLWSGKAHGRSMPGARVLRPRLSWCGPLESGSRRPRTRGVVMVSALAGWGHCSERAATFRSCSLARPVFFPFQPGVAKSAGRGAGALSPSRRPYN